MAPKLSKLAKQYQKALADLDTARKAADEARGPWLDEAAAARADLLAELIEFGEAAGLRVGRGGAGITLAHAGRSVTFTEGAHGDTIDSDGGATIVLAPDGVWGADFGDGPMPLVDRGLRRLLADALNVPDPAGEFTAAPVAKAAPAPKPTKAAKAPVEKPAVQTITVPETTTEGVGAPNPDGRDLGFLGRSGTRKFKRSRDVPPGGLIKDLKGPGPV